MTPDVRSALVVGLGNPERGDDGVGAEVVRRVAARALDGVRVFHLQEPVHLLDESPDADLVVVVDAVLGPTRPGAVTVHEVDDRPLESWTGTGGTHAVGLAAVVELARALDRLPRRLVLVGVEASVFDTGTRLSPPVQAAVDEAADVVVRLVQAQQVDR
ncbi:MAG: hydrogenase maturation protease [Actinomycetes bacterium]